MKIVVIKCEEETAKTIGQMLPQEPGLHYLVVSPESGLIIAQVCDLEVNHLYSVEE